MAGDPDDLEQNIENLKTSVRKSFARIYASLKARELKTLRQLDAIHKQCQDNKELEKNCVQNINISYSDESTLLDIVSNFGVIDFERLSFDNSTFILEDYISPNDDHMYSYKTIEEITENEDIEAIEEAALEQITKTEDCVCIVNVKTEAISKKFRDINADLNAQKVNVNNEVHECKDIETVDNNLETFTEDGNLHDSDPEVIKINPTDDWLNSIKNQTETEPTQVTDVMEHSTIACS
ncbi:uncharacterized protein LOC112045071 [Bicyclus anynana]|uniref:Uncharacterized protein LOC112045071 n=1 Tax=Bicyclus anynana TaxID=110368 RepID=A0A6J1MQZ4_BICAN|nr:uncharacterized protein LOC112045071 [Bicyclus anynana]